MFSDDENDDLMALSIAEEHDLHFMPTILSSALLLLFDALACLLSSLEQQLAFAAGQQARVVSAIGLLSSPNKDASCSLRFSISSLATMEGGMGDEVMVST